MKLPAYWSLVALAATVNSCAWAGASPVKLKPGAESVKLFWGSPVGTPVGALTVCAHIKSLSVQDGFYRQSQSESTDCSLDAALLRLRNAAAAAGANAVLMTEASETSSAHRSGCQAVAKGVAYSCPKEVLLSPVGCQAIGKGTAYTCSNEVLLSPIEGSNYHEPDGVRTAPAGADRGR